MTARTLRLLLALLVTCSAAVATASPASGAYCGQVWGSAARTVGSSTPDDLLRARVGRHRCFDRLVLDMSSGDHGWLLSYADGQRQPAIFSPVGRAALLIYAKTEGPQGLAAQNLRVANVAGFRTFRRVLSVSPTSTVIQLDVRARLPFRAFVLPGPGGGSRLVVDVGHRW